ncbi:hypothetical protein P0100_20565, partial [Yersinia pestis]|nr:hypothetical protein [Yersinia pestis]
GNISKVVTPITGNMKGIIESTSTISYEAGKISELLAPLTENLNEIAESIGLVTNVPSFEFNNPESLIDNINKACLANTKYGWCLSANMTIAGYRKIAKDHDSQEVKDRLFVNEFEADNFELYEQEKRFIIHSAQEGWQDFYEECFYLIDNQKYRAVVPALLSSIEHELSFEQNNDIGKGLIRRVESSLENEDKTSFLYAISTSVLNLLKNIIFERHNFNEDRLPIINRNWVLHGRDTPTFWSKEDVYKLITVISGLRMINERV